MAPTPHHYETAFERYLRARRIPYVSVDEARKALLPTDHAFRVHCESAAPGTSPASHSLKSFDYVIYGAGANLLVEVKGRKVGRARGSPGSGAYRSRLQSWVGLDDVESLKVWQQLFGPQFRACFVFIYWCEEQTPDGLFQEVFIQDGCWYAVRAVMLDDYARAMKIRSPRWRTVHVRTDDFERISHPLTPALEQSAESPPGCEPVFASP
ncbi:MAG: hypothetical protein AMXMBFR58_30740 [Phycisphaerae bacterium]